jgi:hypothetical protein
MSRGIQVKNRAPAPIQITAEQILRESRDRQIDVEVSTLIRILLSHLLFLYQAVALCSQIASPASTL